VLDELDIDDDLFYERAPSQTEGEYWRKNYQRMVGYVRRFRELALHDTISAYEVGQLQRELDSALEYVA
jgi:hypothetical protein